MDEPNGRVQRFKDYLRNVMRVLHVSSKPSGEEYWTSAKISGIGILAIGVVGFIIFVIFQFIGIF